MTTWWQQGLNPSLNEVCRLVGISKPALYREFGGADGLMEAALEAYRQRAIVPLLALFQSKGSFSDVLDRVVETLTSDLGLPAGCLFTRMRTSDSGLGEGTEARVLRLVTERRAAFQARFQQALDAGEANPDVAPELAGRYIDNQLTGLLVRMGDGEDPHQVRAEVLLALRVLLP